MSGSGNQLQTLPAGGAITPNGLLVGESDSGPIYANPEQVGDSQNSLLAGVRSYFAPQQGYQYGNVLPLKMGPQGGVSLAVPNMVRGLVNGGIDLLEGTTTGQVTPQATNALIASAAPELAKDPADSVGPNVFAGIGSKTFDKRNLDTAQAFQQGYSLVSGLGKGPASRNEIWSKTGMFQDPIDNKWRYEIPDGSANITSLFGKAQARINAGVAGMTDEQKSAMQTSVKNPPGISTTLETVLNHPKLFQAYPDLAKMTVVSAPRGTVYDSSIYGGYTPGTIATPEHIYVASDLNPVETKETLLHEIQHAIQEREGFAPGGNTDTGLEMHNKLQIMMHNLPPGSDLPDYALTNPWDAYQSLAGEIESRNIEERAGMSPQQVATVPPWYTEPKTANAKINPDAVQKAWEKYVDNYHAQNQYSNLEPSPWLAGKGTR